MESEKQQGPPKLPQIPQVLHFLTSSLQTEEDQDDEYKCVCLCISGPNQMLTIGTPQHNI